MRKLIIIIGLLFVSHPLLIAQTLNEQAVLKYVETYCSVAVKCGEQYHVPASILLAQALIYTKAGTNHLSKIPNNHMAVTCTKNDVDNRYHQDDNLKNICFKKYEKVEDSYLDYLKKINENALYAPLFKLDSKDYKGWANGLQKIGHSTSPSYGNQLIQLIETYKLFRFDSPIVEKQEVPKEEPVVVEVPIRVEIDPALLEPKTTEKPKQTEPTQIPLVEIVDSSKTNPSISVITPEPKLDTISTSTVIPVQEETKPIVSRVYTITDISGLATVYYPYSDRPVYEQDGLKFVIAVKGDSFEKIAQSVQLPETHLRLYNDLYEYKYQPVEGEVVYIQKKKTKCKTEYHTIEMGESLRYISQIYGIQLEKILERNDEENIGVGYILCISCKK